MFPWSHKENSMLTRSVLLRTALATAALVVLAGCGAMKSSSSSSASTSASASTAKMDTYEATLAGSSEVPANPSTGTGKAEVQVDPSSYKLKWKVNYSGLSGPATMGHIHGPAAPTANAGVQVPFTDVTKPTISGEAQLTPAQYADLAAGLYYVNIHSAQFPGGEIRGQLRKRP
jgi:hypothetical protein